MVEVCVGMVEVCVGVKVCVGVEVCVGDGGGVCRSGDV